MGELQEALYMYVEKGKAYSARFFVGVIMTIFMTIFFLFGCFLTVSLGSLLFSEIQFLTIILTILSAWATFLLGLFGWRWAGLLWLLLQPIDAAGNYYARTRLNPVSDPTKKHLGKQF